MKEILLKNGGLRSTVERRNFWIYSSKLNRIRDSYPNKYYEELVSNNLNESLTDKTLMSEIGKDIGRTFPDL